MHGFEFPPLPSQPLPVCLTTSSHNRVEGSFLGSVLLTPILFELDHHFHKVISRPPGQQVDSKTAVQKEDCRFCLEDLFETGKYQIHLNKIRQNDPSNVSNDPSKLILHNADCNYKVLTGQGQACRQGRVRGREPACGERGGPCRICKKNVQTK